MTLAGHGAGAGEGIVGRRVDHHGPPYAGIRNKSQQKKIKRGNAHPITANKNRKSLSGKGKKKRITKLDLENLGRSYVGGKRGDRESFPGDVRNTHFHWSFGSKYGWAKRRS